MGKRNNKRKTTFVPLTHDRAREARERELKELERLMSHDAYERRSGALRQIRHTT